MQVGHFTGFGRNLLEEDAAVQTSMGPILDRTKEHLASGDAAVAHTRRVLLDALRAAEAGELPPGSARSPRADSAPERGRGGARRGAAVAGPCPRPSRRRLTRLQGRLDAVASHTARHARDDRNRHWRPPSLHGWMMILPIAPRSPMSRSAAATSSRSNVAPM